MGLKNRRSSFSQLKTALIFPGSRGKTTKGALVRAYKDSTILSCTTSGGYQVGLLLGAGQPSALQPSPPVPGMWYLVYFYGNGMCLETCSYPPDAQRDGTIKGSASRPSFVTCVCAALKRNAPHISSWRSQRWPDWR